MGSSQEDSNKKRSVNVTSSGSRSVPTVSENCVGELKTQSFPDNAARKRMKANKPDPHPPRFSAAFAHDKGSRVEMEGTSNTLMT